MKKITESLGTDRYYNYDLYNTITGTDKEGDKYTSYIFNFQNKLEQNYYVTITFFDFDSTSFTVDFQEEESFMKDNDNNKDILDRTYVNTNTYDSFMILSTVIKIIKDFYEHNKDILHQFRFVAKGDKRYNIYKSMIKKEFPEWKITMDSIVGDVHHVVYNF